MSVDSRNVSKNETRRIIEEMCQPLKLGDDTLQKIKEMFLKETEVRLRKTTRTPPIVKCFPTYVQKLPTGCEKGRCLILDINSSHVRIVLITMNQQIDYRHIAKKYDSPVDILERPGEKLFDFLAECLINFVKNLSLHFEELPLAFYFKYPTNQYDLQKGELIGLENNFFLQDGNVVELLREAVERKSEINISDYTLVNDTTAVLMACARRNYNTKIGLVVDKGCNASYLEQLKHMTTFEKAKTIPTIPTMIINTEWAFFGDNGSIDFIRTPWDVEIDELSSKKHERTLEKMVGGLYLGALVRLILLDCIKSGAILQGEITAKLEKENSFHTSYIINIDCQCNSCHSKTRDVLRLLGYKNPTTLDCNIVCYICEIVTRRSAYLVAATLACLIDRIGDPYVVVGIDGSVFRNFLNYRKYLEEKLRQLVKPEHKFDLIVSEHETDYGAALAAFEVNKQNKIIIKRNNSSVFNPAVTIVSKSKHILKKKRNIPKKHIKRIKVKTTYIS